ncbi:molybdopterin-dependent oxidoreductase [Amycolatopsis rubida]|uniref:Molybdopterin-dependent oxidoreductase n=1 Tax=Amycolatopsis rubida TaxID=112413 RepID=A0ABX0CCF8_9PSEU|nr:MULTISPECIES: molybdopterin-dependent oxidoreductase [Amycolatopsis]MYW97667.1 molybdopterin-dependent oxidoreductase [Amycolatopsis rubida]NEC62653.1 molybdopterin-dependent oxidoreductase [Amycolatopsis rubida]OAP21841.1 Sulfoxide reductase catalytic subunit YedY [Amycolatopsis sp. M39]
MTATEVSRPAPSRLRLPSAAWCGVLALLAALAAGHLVASFVSINASPYLAVGNGAIDLTPVRLKDFAVRTFGTYDKLVLLSGMAAVMAVASAAAGMLSARSPRPGVAIIALFGVVGGIAVYARPDLSAVALLAPLASLVVGVAAFVLLHRLAPRKQDASKHASAGSSRRSFLLGGAGIVVGAGALGGVGQLISGTRDATASRAAVGKLMPATAAPAIPADADFAKLGTPSFLTPNPNFYRVDTALSVPQVRTEDWSLRIHGMVGKERTYTYADIRNRPLVERTITMTCVSNEVGGDYVSTSDFIGVDLADLLAEAGVRPGAQQLFCTSVDGWTSGTPVAAALDRGRGAMLAIGMNREPLPLEHGFPARLVTPGLYGYVSATKWVVDIEVTTWKARQAYWLKRGWGEQAPIKTESRIDTPKGFATVPAGAVRLAGIAWAQHNGIEKVEVRVDSGAWQPVTLSAEVNLNTWRMWWTQIAVKPGTHQVFVRATDKTGYTQTDQRAGTVPDGATGWHSTTFIAA